MAIEEILQGLRRDADFMREVADWQRAPAAAARYADWPAVLHPQVVKAYAERGIERPYTHQTQAIEAVLQGENVVVVANAAGGKSLCFHAPIAHEMLTNPNARALLLFPTKALAQDQMAALNLLLDDGRRTMDDRISIVHRPSSIVQSYDGDTPQAKRADIRREARVVVSNADMLHVGILPHHTRWASFFKNLRYVVIDEMHTYRGIFGSHVANVIRRLKRLCAFYGAKPVFILASATIANPQEHAERLLEDNVTLVDNDGSPRGERNVILYNPPMLDAELGIRQSAEFAVRDIAKRFISADAQTICFARSRQGTEVLLRDLRLVVDDFDGGRKTVDGKARSSVSRLPSVVAYRGGYLPEERRAIEKGLRAGTVRGVVATNALELGIDIGELDACVMMGYPGSVASFWQQAGRAGRRQRPSVAVLVTNANALDQYLAAHPEHLFSQNPEFARVAPDNLGVLAAHVACATFELPFNSDESLGRAHIDDILDALAEEGEVHVSGGVSGLPLFKTEGGERRTEDGNTRSPVSRPPSRSRYTWVGDGYPADRTGLRGVGDRVMIECEGTIIGETERSTAPMRVYPGAIYIHQGQTYQVYELDWENGSARTVQRDSDYYTQPSTANEVVVMSEFGEGASESGVRVGSDESQVISHESNAPSSPYPLISSSSPSSAKPAFGEIEVTTRVGRFRQVDFATHQTVGWGDLEVPAQTLATVGYWFAIPQEIAEQLDKEGVLGLAIDYGPNWQRQRKAARERDGYKCSVCGKPESPMREHHVHHKKPFRQFGYVRDENENYLKANDLSNLMTVCAECHVKVETAQAVNNPLNSLCYLLGNLAPLFVMCDPSDINAIYEIDSPHTRLPTITLYEMTPGGTGLMEELIQHHTPLLSMAAQRIRECPCKRGCPACVGPVDELQARNVKTDTLRLIEMLLSK